MRISIIVARVIADELRRRGISYETACSGTPIESEMLADPSVRISFGDYAAFVGRALELTNEPQLGLYVGAHAPQAVTVLAPMVAASSTLREASELFFSYQALFFDGAHWHLDVDGGTARLVFDMPSDIPHAEFTSELSVMMVVGALRPFLNVVANPRVRFAHSPTGPHATYERFLRSPIEFDAPETALQSDSTSLDVRQLYADAALRETLRKRADAMLSDLRSPDRLPSRIRDFVAMHPRPSSISTATLAEAMGMSERTLRRRLVELGASPRDLVEETLCDLACTTLRDTAVPIKEVAFKLGFSETSSFHRAFKRWTGSTPAEFRTTARGGDAG